MSSFDVKARRVTITPHNNANSLELGQVDDYNVVVGKGQFQTGDVAIYIPEQAIVPQNILEEMELVGRLGGSQKNRVKAIKLRGELSQGLLYKPKDFPLEEGVDYAEKLGIVKYAPEIPSSLQGKVMGVPGVGQESINQVFFQSYTDIENIKKFPHAFDDGEEVIFTEKLHGSCCIIGIIGGHRVVSSKGIAKRDLVLQESDSNDYWRVAKQFRLHEKLEKFLESYGNLVDDAILYGEVLGVQERDMHYGLNMDVRQLDYRAFDMLVNWKSTRPGYMDYVTLRSVLSLLDIPMVPELYVGPFSKEVMIEYTNGTSKLANHIREGIVIRKHFETSKKDVGRLIMKSVSPAYLIRKGGTEYE